MFVDCRGIRRRNQTKNESKKKRSQRIVTDIHRYTVNNYLVPKSKEIGNNCEKDFKKNNKNKMETRKKKKIIWLINLGSGA